jgi:hypothetical protein
MRESEVINRFLLDRFLDWVWGEPWESNLWLSFLDKRETKK